MSVPQLLTLFVCTLVLHSATVIQSGPLFSRVDNPDLVPGPALHKRVARSDHWWDRAPYHVEDPKVTRPVPPPRKRHDGKEDPTTRSTASHSIHSTRSIEKQEHQQQEQQEQQQEEHQQQLQLNMIPWYENTLVQLALGLGLLVILLVCIIFCLYCSNLLKSKSSKTKKTRKTPKSGAKSGVKSGQGSTGSRITSPGTTGQSNESRLGTLGSSLHGSSPGQSNESRLGSLPSSGQGTSPGQRSKESRLESGTKSGPKSRLTSPGSQGTGGKASQSN